MDGTKQKKTDSYGSRHEGTASYEYDLSVSSTSIFDSEHTKSVDT